MKDILKKILKSLRSNMLLKIIALIFGIILWCYVMVETNPSRDKLISNVGIRFDGVSSLEDKGLVIVEDLSSILSSANVTVSAKQRDLQYINQSNVTGVVDFSQINSTGEITLSVNAEAKYGTTVHVSPSQVTVTVDDNVSRDIPVTLAQTGEQSEDYYYANPVLSPSKITVTGPRSVLETIVRAECALDYTGVTNDVNQSLKVTLYNQNNEPVEDGRFSALPSCSVYVRVLPVKDVPVDAESSLEGGDKLKEGYEVTGVRVEPSLVRVAGLSRVLEDVLQAFTEPVDVTGASASVVKNVTLRDIEGVTYVNDPRVKVYVDIAEKQGTKTFSKEKIDIRGLSAGLKATLEKSSVDVRASGGVLELARLNSQNVTPYVDLTGLGAGTHDLAIKFDPVGDARVSLVSSPATIKVVIS